MSLDTAKATVVVRGITAKFDAAAKAATPFYPTLCTEVPSSGADERYGWLGAMPSVKEWLGDRKFEELRAADFTLKNKKWESSMLISKDDIADDRLGMYGPLAENLAAEAMRHPDSLLFDLILAGAATACFDGQYFFDTDHAWGDSGSQDNDLTGAAATGTDPTAAEFRAAFHACRLKMVGYKNDRGKPLNRPTMGAMSNLLVVVPPEMQLAATEGLTAPILSNNSNVVLDQPKIICSPYATSAATFWLFDLSGPMKPFVFQKREPLSRGVKGLDDLETKDVKFMTQARYNVGYLAWWKAVQYVFT